MVCVCVEEMIMSGGKKRGKGEKGVEKLEKVGWFTVISPPLICI